MSAVTRMQGSSNVEDAVSDRSSGFFTRGVFIARLYWRYVSPRGVGANKDCWIGVKAEIYGGFVNCRKISLVAVVHEVPRRSKCDSSV